MFYCGLFGAGESVQQPKPARRPQATTCTPFRQYRCAAVHRVLRDREKAAAAAAAASDVPLHDGESQQHSNYIFKHMHVFTRAGSSSSDIAGSSSSGSSAASGSAACARSDAAAAAAADGESQFGSSSGASPFPLTTPVGWQEEEDREGAAVVAARCACDCARYSDMPGSCELDAIITGEHSIETK
eukprot:18219-Heterococcus_DN1.PRE.1